MNKKELIKIVIDNKDKLPLSYTKIEILKIRKDFVNYDKNFYKAITRF